MAGVSDVLWCQSFRLAGVEIGMGLKGAIWIRGIKYTADPGTDFRIPTVSEVAEARVRELKRQGLKAVYRKTTMTDGTEDAYQVFCYDPEGVT